MNKIFDEPLIGACIFGQSGGPTAVINASAYGVIRTALDCDAITKVYGAAYGIKGVLEDELYDMGEEEDYELKLLLNTPSSELGSCRYKMADPDVDDTDYKRVLEIFKKYDVRYFFYNGGNDSMDTCNKISRYMEKVGYECRVIGVPKTIDNDLSCTDYTFGFETASNIAMEAIDRLQTTAKAHSRCIVVECMGRHTGWIALQAGLAANAHLVLIPEFPKSYDEIISVVRRRYLRGDRYTIIVVAEGFELLGGDEIDLGTDAFGNKLLIHKNLAKNLSDMIEDTMRNDPLLGSDAQYFECRPVVLGHVQRGGAPCAFDRVLGTRLGIKAGELVVRRDYGKMVALNGNSIVGADLETAVTVRKEVDREFYEAASLYFK